MLRTAQKRHRCTDEETLFMDVKEDRCYDFENPGPAVCRAHASPADARRHIGGCYGRGGPLQRRRPGHRHRPGHLGKHADQSDGRDGDGQRGAGPTDQALRECGLLRDDVLQIRTRAGLRDQVPEIPHRPAGHLQRPRRQQGRGHQQPGRREPQHPNGVLRLQQQRV